MDRSAPTRSQYLLQEIRTRLKGFSAFACLPIGSRLLREQRINHHRTLENLAHRLGQNACDRIEQARVPRAATPPPLRPVRIRILAVECRLSCDPPVGV